MRWYVCTMRKIIIGRFPNKKYALRFALKTLRQGSYPALYVLSEDDYERNITSRIVKINYKPDLGESIDDLAEEYIEVII
ncbi:hypothetical protein [Thermosipho globiformans]|uniref:hypothetical protein n=1 Tax=Thermosipho globiformans TaxID=380685 RepID=UPI000F8F76BA|nr:hypothetical protein [Thermosipho globiformans]